MTDTFLSLAACALGSPAREHLPSLHPDRADVLRRGEVEDALELVGGAREHAVAGEVGERGRGLSSAQQQIIALARAELIDPDVMVLDEATANIDPAVEADVVRAIALATRSRVAIIIAHRLSTAELADNIAVVSAGKIVEQGRHQELLESGGSYADLVAASRGSR